MTRTPKLTDTQLMLLSGASQRQDGLLDLAARLRGYALQMTAEKLLKGELAEEVSVDSDQPAWRSDEWESRIGLRITVTGLRAIGIEAEMPTDAADQASLDNATPAQSEEPPRPSERVLRGGSKKALVISLLNRDTGATLDDLVAATGWLPHTTRAALTGLRKSGYTIAGEKSTGKTVYRMTPRRDAVAIHEAA